MRQNRKKNVVTPMAECFFQIGLGHGDPNVQNSSYATIHHITCDMIISLDGSTTDPHVPWSLTISLITNRMRVVIFVDLSL